MGVRPLLFGTVTLLAALPAGCAHRNAAEPAPRRRTVGDAASVAMPAGPPAVQAPEPAPALLAAGTPAPEVAAPNQRGKLVRLQDLRGKYVVLYFYRQDFNRACTFEARKFQADYERYRGMGAEVVGVSADDVAMHKEFAERESLEFTLWSDPADRIARAFGVPVEQFEQRRVTFVIDRDGVIRKTFAAVQPGTHAEEVMAVVRGLHDADAKVEAAKRAEEEAAAKKAAREAAAKKAADEVAAKKAAKEEAKAAKAARRKPKDAKAAKNVQAPASTGEQKPQEDKKGGEKGPETTASAPDAASPEKNQAKDKDAK